MVCEVTSCPRYAKNHIENVLSNEESTSILHLPVKMSLQTSLNIFLESEKLTEPDSFLIFARVTNLHLWTTKSSKWVTMLSCN